MSEIMNNKFHIILCSLHILYKHIDASAKKVIFWGVFLVCLDFLKPVGRV